MSETMLAYYADRRARLYTGEHRRDVPVDSPSQALDALGFPPVLMGERV